MDWSRLPKYMLGPVQKFLMKRALTIYAVCAVIGMLPSFLARFGGMDISYRIQTAGWGFVFPGAG
ncbi:MAG: hypothetical protein K6G83_03170, partial [Lachnospiraceae bacterium]|nr:hypothetical protein [Lachnospiraceae bacterium]